ncbi:ABC transporter permease [Nonomuraea gerenzanensis]|uniref:Putative transmembrane transport protein n=1 Tax=Nonomuraea gerenzanensis TaxID=93944 RepID=A0A1M4ELA7_9ACTN|nr:ABC transporter permease [Nonomuraea gerenzanensis]UBU11170.1 ABC transporter permease [Nonomuraea gerenzanensis]SBO99640.1 putative transmembrane transport protein [Nonomuraea gerenzanensis]
MIWLTWRQLRGAATMTAALLVLLAAILLLTGSQLAADHASGVGSCVRGEDCELFYDRFFQDYEIPFLASTLVVLILPALVGLFWGAPLITRELEAGTYQLVWNQSITRTRWLAVKLGFTGLVAMAAAGVSGLAVTWWSGPLDQSAPEGFALMDPLVFSARGIAPLGYAAFAFALGVTVGMFVRRTLAAMALTLLVFATVQIAVPLLVRPYLIPPVTATFELGRQNVDGLNMGRDGSFSLAIESAIPGHTGSWTLSSDLVDPSGRVIAPSGEPAPIPVSTTSGPCSQSGAGPQGGEACMVEVNRLGYRQQATYQPLERFWPLQWIETGLYALLTLGLTGLSFWWVRRRLS